jgi:hypothetical protein
MDEQEMTAAFRDAARDAPPAGFDVAEVLAGSRRVTVRRRAALAGAGLAVVALAGVGVTAGLGARDAGDPTSAAAPAAAPAGDAAGGPAAPEGDAAGAAAPAPEAARAAPPPAAPGAVAPLGPGTTDCADRQDPALRSLVDQALPAVAGAAEAPTTQECRPGGERGVVVEVDGGVLSVTYLPPGATPRLTEGATAAPTASGGTVLVFSRPTRAGDPAPLADEVAGAVAYLAPRL